MIKAFYVLYETNNQHTDDLCPGSIFIVYGTTYMLGGILAEDGALSDATYITDNKIPPLV